MKKFLLFIPFILATVAGAQSFSPSDSAIASAPTPSSCLQSNYSSGSYTGTISVALSTTSSCSPSTNLAIFYTLDGTPASPASILYTGPISISSTTTLNAIAVQVGTFVPEQNDLDSPTNLELNLACKASQCAPYIPYNIGTLSIKYGPGNTSTGVSGIPTGVQYTPLQSSPPSLQNGGGHTTLIGMTTENISGAGSQTQILIPRNNSTHHNPCANGSVGCNFQAEHFAIQAVNSPHQAPPWAYEQDLVYWYGGYIWSAALQCLTGHGWEYNGQNSPGWTEFGKNGITVYKNGVATSINGTSVLLNEGCLPSTTTPTIVTYIADFIPGTTGCSNSGAVPCIYIRELDIQVGTTGTYDSYTFGTQVVSGETVSKLAVPGAIVSGYPGDCFHQFQIDTAGTGASTGNPLTMAENVLASNMTCGLNSNVATQSWTFTF
jgi:chitobiase/beta-hexosaminidase-like protein